MSVITTAPSVSRARRRARRRARTLGLAAAAALLLAPAAARADIFAAVEVPSPGGADLDIAIVNATTGARTPLPAGVNTPADEVHPSLSANARRLTFARIDRAGGTRRVILVDLSTGQLADLVNAFDAARDQPGTPTLLPDGSQVITGRPLESLDPSLPSSFRQPSINTTALDSFPAGPFARTQRAFPVSFGVAGRSLAFSPTSATGLLAFAVRFDSIGRQVLLLSGATTAVTGESVASLQHPALAASSGQVVFERAPQAGSGFGPASLVFKPANLSTWGTGASVALPATVNAPGLDQSRPAFTPEGRFLLFVRRGADGRERLLVFDTQSQVLLNPAGVDLGALDTSQGIGQLRRIDGNVAPFQRLVLSSLSITSAGILRTQVLQPTRVGILVQRVTGFHRFLGRRVPRLRLVGRVPFGPRRAGRARIRWSLRVNGRPLAPGTYLVTPRSVTAAGVVRETARPLVLRVPRRPVRGR